MKDQFNSRGQWPGPLISWCEPQRQTRQAQQWDCKSAQPFPYIQHMRNAPQNLVETKKILLAATTEKVLEEPAYGCLWRWPLSNESNKAEPILTLLWGWWRASRTGCSWNLWLTQNNSKWARGKQRSEPGEPQTQMNPTGPCNSPKVTGLIRGTDQTKNLHG